MRQFLIIYFRNNQLVIQYIEIIKIHDEYYCVEQLIIEQIKNIIDLYPLFGID
jgi:hypothetical protein